MSDTEFLIYTIIVVLIILLILWLFFGGNEYKDHELDIANHFYLPKKIERDSSEIVDEICKTEDESNISKTENNLATISNIEDKLIYSEVDEICKTENKEESRINLVIKFLPSYDIEYYRDFILTTEKGIKKMEKKNANESRGEKLCRSILEKFFNKPFLSARPDFLLNPETNRNLELDCFNQELMLALEYNGAQHYDWPNTFHKTFEEFEGQRRRDDLKRRICEASGVYLITVPFRVTHYNLPKYIEYYLPENVQHRRENGIDEITEDAFWDDDTTTFPKNPRF